MNMCGGERREGCEDGQSHRLLEKYIAVVRLHRHTLERRLSSTGVYRSQHQILMCIADHPGASQKEIAGIYRASASTVAVSLKKLEKGGYIKRVVDQEDNRYNQLMITEKGQELMERSKRLFRQAEDAMFLGFSGEELDTLNGYLDRIRQNMEELLQEAEGADGL